MQIAIAGATGFVGKALHAHLVREHKIIALSRTAPQGPGPDGAQWRTCNLFNLESVQNALSGCDTAMYLVHSMQPQEPLVHGSFTDLDLVCADNFGRAAAHAGVKHIIYLGGIIPQSSELSTHLASRLEVEEALRSYGVPCTALRAAVVVGAEGSSFEIMRKMTQRLPVLAVPKCMQSQTQPIALSDVLALLAYCVENPSVAGRHYDIGGPDVMSYADMLRVVAATVGKPLTVVEMPVNVPLTARFVSLVTGTSLDLVAPLVQSLQHEMVVRDGGILQKQAGIVGKSFRQSVHDAITATHGKTAPHPSKPKQGAPKKSAEVLSIQRAHLPDGATMAWVADEFAAWLDSTLHPVASVQSSGDKAYDVGLSVGSEARLHVQPTGEKPSDNRITFALSNSSGVHVELREALGGRVVLSSLQATVPRRGPRYLKRWGQAAVHKGAMHLFAKHLDKMHHI